MKLLVLIELMIFYWRSYIQLHGAEIHLLERVDPESPIILPTRQSLQKHDKVAWVWEIFD